MTRRPPKSTLTETPFPYTTLCRSCAQGPGPGPDHVGAQPLVRDGFGRRANSRDAQIPEPARLRARLDRRPGARTASIDRADRKSTSELQSLMRNSYAVFCFKKKNNYHSFSSTDCPCYCISCI